MKGSSLLFMISSWMLVVTFAVFCFTVIFREGEGKASVLKGIEEISPEEKEEIT